MLATFIGLIIIIYPFMVGLFVICPFLGLDSNFSLFCIDSNNLPLLELDSY